MKTLLKIFIAMFPLIAFADTGYEELDFDVSMSKKNYAQYNLMQNNESSKKAIHFYKNLYNKNLPSKIKPDDLPKIPAIIHFIDLGDETDKVNLQNSIKSCQKFHPNWQFKVWDEKAIKGQNYDKNSLYKIFKDDKKGRQKILQYLILQDHGGVFIDSNHKCMQNLSELNRKYSFYSGLKTPSDKRDMPVLSSSLIASQKQQPIIEQAIARSESKLKKYNDSKNSYYKRAIRIAKNYFSDKKTDGIKLPPYSAVFSDELSDIIEQADKNGEIVIIFPSSYLDPLSTKERGNFNTINQMKKRLGVVTQKQVFSDHKPEALVAPQ